MQVVVVLAGEQLHVNAHDVGVWTLIRDFTELRKPINTLKFYSMKGYGYGLCAVQ